MKKNIFRRLAIIAAIIALFIIIHISIVAANLYFRILSEQLFFCLPEPPKTIQI